MDDDSSKIIIEPKKKPLVELTRNQRKKLQLEQKRNKQAVKAESNDPLRGLTSQEIGVINYVNSIFSNNLDLAAIVTVAKNYNFESDQCVQFFLNGENPMTSTQKKVEPQSHKKSTEKKKNGTPQRPVDIANQLLNECFDQLDLVQNEVLTSQQFSLFFDEITAMMQLTNEDNLLGTNDLVDQFRSMKEEMIASLGQESTKDERLNQFKELDRNLQKFIEQQNKKQYIQLNPKDYPAMEPIDSKIKKNKKPQTNQMNKSTIAYTRAELPPEKSLIAQIQKESKKVSLESDAKPHRELPRQLLLNLNRQSIFSVDNSIANGQSVEALHKQFNLLSVEKIQFAFLQLQNSEYLTRSFLKQYYGENFRKQPVARTVSVYQQPVSHLAKERRLYQNLLQQPASVDKCLAALSYEQIREQLVYLMSVHETIRCTRARFKSARGIRWVEHIEEVNQPMLHKLIEASRFRAIEKCQQSQDPAFLDLHGYREIQVDGVVNDLVLMIQKEACASKEFGDLGRGVQEDS